MALPDDRLQQLIEGKDTESAVGGESWVIIDGVLVISDIDDQPAWYRAVYESRDDNGDTPEEFVSLPKRELQALREVAAKYDDLCR